MRRKPHPYAMALSYYWAGDNSPVRGLLQWKSSGRRCSRFRVVILSNAFWRNQFGADPGIIGRSVRLDGHEATVVVVLATDPDYFGLAKIWTPLALSRDPNGRTSHFLSAVAPAKARVAIRQAQTELDAIALRITDNRIDGVNWVCSLFPSKPH